MAEHELCKLGVTGSNPVASTLIRSVAGRMVLSYGRQATFDVTKRGLPFEAPRGGAQKGV